jgi:hypothetical protein
MKIIAKRPFISSRPGFGNIPAGRILDTDDAYAKMLINAGLAEEYSAAPSLMADRQKSFTSPVGANAKNGPSSQAGQASRSQTVKKSKSGVKKTKTAK